MGCTYDVFTGKLKQKEYNQDFVDIWNRVLKDDLYDDWAQMDVGVFDIDENGENIFGIDSEPLFCTMECGEQIEKFLVEFFKAHPDAELEAEYECTYNNCGDMNLKYFTYSNGVIHIKALNSEEPYIYECPECEEEIDAEEEDFSMHFWNPDKPFVCKHCGAEIEMEVYVDEYDIDVATGDYTYKNEEDEEDNE